MNIVRKILESYNINIVLNEDINITDDEIIKI